VPFRGAVGYATARAAVKSFSGYLEHDVRQLGIGVTLLNAMEISGVSKQTTISPTPLHCNVVWWLFRAHSHRHATHSRIHADHVHSQTEYFSNAPGKAGGDSHQKIPAILQLVDKLGLNTSTQNAAASALNGVQRGWATVLCPGWMMIPLIQVGACRQRPVSLP